MLYSLKFGSDSGTNRNLPIGTLLGFALNDVLSSTIFLWHPLMDINNGLPFKGLNAKLSHIYFAIQSVDIRDFGW